jgi:hypothetical protein
MFRYHSVENIFYDVSCPSNEHSSYINLVRLKTGGIFILDYFQKAKSFTDVTIGHSLGDSKIKSYVFSRLSTENDFLLP